ncbi:MAG: CarD family transcriptional regulator [Euzebya sp.]
MSASFKPGDDVVHPIHGPGTVTAVQLRDTPEGPVEYVSMQVDGMTIMIPRTELEGIGVRDPISSDEAHAILQLLAEDPLSDPGHAARRRRNQSRLVGGDAEALAQIVRSLRTLKAGRDKALPMHDTNHLRLATDQLVGELAIAMEVSRDEAAKLVEAAVLSSIDSGQDQA